MSIKDELKDKSVKGILTKLNDGKYSLKLSEDDEYLVFNRNKEKGFTLPEEMILTRVE